MDQIWTECFFLEETVPAFKGLRKSLLLPFIAKQCQEYFKVSQYSLKRKITMKLNKVSAYEKKSVIRHRDTNVCQEVVLSRKKNC